MLHVRDRTRGATELCFDITVTDPDGSVTVELDGVRMRRVPGRADRAPMRYETALRAAPHLRLPAAASPLPGNHDLAGAVTPSVEAAQADALSVRFADSVTRFKQLTAHMAAAAFTDLLPADTAEFTLSDLVRHGMLPGHDRLARALLGLMSRHCLAAVGDGERWRLTGTADPEPLAARLPLNFPAWSAEVQLAVRQLSHLPQVLRGERDALHLLTGQGCQEALEQFYDVAPSCRLHNRLVAALVAEIVRAWPQDRPLRILEIGAGTGGTTAAVLPLLPPERAVYHFTDVSAAFFARARHRFGDHSFVDYRTFDLNADPAEQGFTDGGYDLVVAANALHTATNLRTALSRVRALLAPGGRLLAFEAHDTDYLLPFSGTLTSFWAHDDELRPGSPLLGRNQWRDVLRACGLTDIVCLGDTFEGAEDMASVLLASAPAYGIAQPALPRPDVDTRWIVATESEAEAPLAEHVAGLLSDGATRSVPVTPAPSDPEAWSASLAGAGDPAVVLVLGEAPADPQAMLDQAVRRAGMLRDLASACLSPDGARPALWLVTRPSGALPAPNGPPSHRTPPSGAWPGPWPTNTPTCE
ncbi:methyltransferase [Streptomyces sp. MS1.AVA.1]|uniref:Methyltransferase n=1 Tax=Streptomyces machairae TaxID=3134109 RepID=A0ABU8UUC7_9ACTN